MNVVILKGNLGGNFKTGATPGGTQTLNVSLATNKFKRSDKRKEKATSWHRIVFYGRSAENAINLLKKGDCILIRGELETRSWEDKKKGWQSVTEVIVNEFDIIKHSSSHYQTDLETQTQQSSTGYQDHIVEGLQASPGVMVYNPEEAQA